MNKLLYSIHGRLIGCMQARFCTLYMYGTHVFPPALYRWEQQRVKLMFFYMLVEFHKLKVLTVFEASFVFSWVDSRHPQALTTGVCMHWQLVWWLHLTADRHMFLLKIHCLHQGSCRECGYAWVARGHWSAACQKWSTPAGLEHKRQDDLWYNQVKQI